MIDKIRLKNFQAHSDTTLEFDKGVNIIVGRSDQGKSSIIRAIRWVVENRPTGIAFRKRNTDMVSVELTVDGQTIVRDKSDKVNRYVIGGEELKALRADVPPSINSMLNFGIANIQTQHEQYFLLQSSAGDAAKTINKIANLQIIGETIRNANAYISSATHDVHYAEDMLKDAHATCAAYEWSVDATHLVEAIDGKRGEAEKTAQRAAELQKLIAAARNCQNVIRTNYAPAVAQKLATVRQYCTLYSVQRQKATALYELVALIKRDSQLACQVQIPVDMSVLKQKTMLFQTASERLSALTSLLSAVTVALKACTAAQTEYIAVRREQRSLKQSVKICPTCGQIIQG